MYFFLKDTSVSSSEHLAHPHLCLDSGDGYRLSRFQGSVTATDAAWHSARLGLRSISVK